MSRSAASGWIGKLFLRRLRCACWDMGSKVACKGRKDTGKEMLADIPEQSRNMIDAPKWYDSKEKYLGRWGL